MQVDSLTAPKSTRRLQQTCPAKPLTHEVPLSYTGCVKRCNGVAYTEMINSAVRAVKLMEILAERGKPIALKEIAHAANLNKVTTHRLLRSLCQGGAVQPMGDNGYYALGPAVLRYAEAFRKSLTMRDRVLPYLEKLATLTKETAIFCERYGKAACVTVETWDSPHDTRTFSGTGIVRPLTEGSSALAILAMLSEEEILAILRSHKLIHPTAFAPNTTKRLLARIKEIRRLGYVVSMRERDLDTGGIAAPVLADQNVIGSIAVIGPVDRMERNGTKKIGKQVRAVVAELTGELTSNSRFVSNGNRKAAG
jgi:DNA-binding IclR family transcriptional regulator